MARTPNERITALEIYNEMVREDMNDLKALIEGVGDKVDKVAEQQRKDHAEFEAVKNRGIGLLIGVGLISGGIGAGAAALWKWLVGG